jgi:hypothetical protein
MLYVVKDAGDAGEVFGAYLDGKVAGERAKALNDAWKREGSGRRVRIVREEAAPEGEPTTWAGGYETPVLITKQGKDHWSSYPRWRKIPEAGSSWRIREMQRYVNRAAIPWIAEPWWLDSPNWELHFPYPAKSNPARIAFTESEERGRADKQTVMRPGAYLRKYFGAYLSDDDVRHWALKWANKFAPVGLHFAATADDIERVYIKGPNSCMGHDAGSFEGGVHPVRAYAGPDLQVAYIHNPDGDIVGRAVVWPAKNMHGRVYGDLERMTSSLHVAGYVASNLEGARLTRIETGAGLHVPYLDGCQNVNDDGEYLTITSSGSICADSTDGTVCQTRCEECGGSVADGEERYGPDHGDTYCDYCFSERYTYCEGCGEYADSDDIRFPADGNDPLCETCYADAYTDCPECATECASDTLIESPDGRDRCESCFHDAVTMCDECSDEIMASDAVDGLCSECAEALVEEEEEEEEKEHDEAESDAEPPTTFVSQSSYGAVEDTATTYTRQEEEEEDLVWCYTNPDGSQVTYRRLVI